MSSLINYAADVLAHHAPLVSIFCAGNGPFVIVHDVPVIHSIVYIISAAAGSWIGTPGGCNGAIIYKYLIY